MSTHPRRRIALACAIAALATGALSGPAMAAGDTDSSAASAVTAGGDQQESGLHVRKAGGDGNTASIIAVL